MTGEVIITILGNDATYAALIGSDGGTVKVYAEEAPQGIAKPYAVYNRVSGTFDQNKDELGFKNYAYQIDHFSDDYDELEDLDSACLDALDHYSGTVAGVNVSSVRTFSSDSGFTSADDAGRITSEFSIKVQP